MTENVVRNYSNHGSEVLTMVTWDMMPYHPVEGLHLLGRRVCLAMSKKEEGSWSQLGIFFNSEYGGNMRITHKLMQHIFFLVHNLFY
jgi:hypothetical protein